MASFTTNTGAARLAGNIDWTSASHTIKARLIASSFTPLKDDTVLTGYTAIGTDQALASGNRVIATDMANDQVKCRYTATLLVISSQKRVKWKNTGAAKQRESMRSSTPPWPSTSVP